MALIATAIAMLLSGASLLHAQQARVPVLAEAPPPAVLGVITGTAPGQMPAALLACGARQGQPVPAARLVQVGDQACGLQLVDVRADGVTMRDASTLAVMSIGLASPAVPAGRPDVDPRTLPELAEPSLAVSRSEDAVHVRLSMTLLEGYVANPVSILAAGTVTPYLQHDDSGRAVLGGLAIGSVKASGLFAQLGLRDGDIIAEVNGATVANLGSVSSLIADFTTARHGTVGVRRDGQQLLFVVDLD